MIVINFLLYSRVTHHKSHGNSSVMIKIKKKRKSTSFLDDGVIPEKVNFTWVQLSVYKRNDIIT